MFSAATARAFPLSTVATLMDTRVLRNPAIADLKSLSALANQMMGGEAQYGHLGVADAKANNLHFTAAQTALRRQHPALLGDLNSFVEEYRIGEATIGEFDRPAIEAEAVNIRSIMDTLIETYGETVMVSSLATDHRGPFISAAMTLLGISPADPRDSYTDPAYLNDK